MVAAQNCDHYLVVRNGEACACARARAWLVGCVVSGCAHWPFNRVEQDQQVRDHEGLGSLPFFLFLPEITFDLGVDVEMSWFLIYF